MSPPAREVVSATAALLAFAGDPAGATSAFDDADISPGTVGGEMRGRSTWDDRRDGLVLTGRDLSSAHFRRANLTRVNLMGATLRGVSAAGVRLDEACLEGAACGGIDLVGASMVAIDAGEADFSEALLEDADLHEARLRFANFSDAIMEGANLAKADLWGAKLHRVAAERTSFDGTRLDESSLVEAELAGATFCGATLRRANLNGAKLRGANFRDATLDGADLTQADLSQATLQNVSLASCHLKQARFANAWLERTRMRAAQLGGCAGEEATGHLDEAIDAYIVLERNFLSLGISEDASWAYRRRRRVGRAVHARDGLRALRARECRAAAGAGLRWMGDVIAEWLCDYGESLTRVVRAFFCTLLLFALVYWLTGSLTPREGMSMAHVFAPVNYLMFSLDSMTTVGTSEVALRPVGELGLVLSSVQTVIGTILLGLFGFVLGARIRS